MIPLHDPSGKYVVRCENSDGERSLCRRGGQELRFTTEEEARRYARWCGHRHKSARYWTEELGQPTVMAPDLPLQDHLSVCMMCTPDTDTLCVAGAAMRAAEEILG